MTARLFPLLAVLTPLLAVAIAPAQAETPAQSSPPVTASPVVPAAHLSAAEIDALIAPVALYPDALLMPLLMASTYPNEVAEAANWLKTDGNPALRGDALVTALEPRPWAPAVKALVPFPETVEILAEHSDWSIPLGKAFAPDPGLVMAEVQKLRHQAVAAGTLKDTVRMKIRPEGEALTIIPADPAQVYVPVYNPSLAYGVWPDAAHPPRYIEPPPGLLITGADLKTGIGFSVGFGTIASLWGWAHPDWQDGTIRIDTAAYNRINRYGPHASAAIWHYEPRLSGYFHITKDQIAAASSAVSKPGGKAQTKSAKSSKAKAPTKVASKAQAKAASKSASRVAHATAKAGKVTKSAKAHDKRKSVAASPHHGKLRVADESRRGRSRR